nr:armadillo repeat-containing protein 8-like isoform X3 [Chrysemys picta bellii]
MVPLRRQKTYNLVIFCEVTASSRHYVDRLFDPDPQKVLQGVIDMKNAVIGNNKQKANLIVLGAVPRLLYLLQQETSSTELRTECAVVLGSLAMGTENNVKSLLDCHIIPALLQGLLSPELKFIEACLRCLRTIFTSPVTPEELLYTDATVIPHLMALLSRSRYTQEYICQIFSHCCKAGGLAFVKITDTTLPLRTSVPVKGSPLPPSSWAEASTLA